LLFKKTEFITSWLYQQDICVGSGLGSFHHEDSEERLEKAKILGGKKTREILRFNKSFDAIFNQLFFKINQETDYQICRLKI
jgi:hypothetical protein